MLHSVPVLWQTIAWLYIGAGGVLALGRRLPDWVRRLAVMTIALLTFHSLTVGGGRVAFFWEPLNLFRLGPVLQADGLALLAGLVLSGVTAALALGIRGTNWTAWHGLLLAALAGAVFMVNATNLLTLALGSALMDLALLALALSAPRGDDRALWRMAVPGLIATYLLFLSALRMDTQVGHASLSPQGMPPSALFLVSLAGLLRLLVFPLHPRHLPTPQSAATLILPAGAGIYLLARAESLGPVLAGQPWVWLIVVAALLAGGVMVWAGGVMARKEPPPGGVAAAVLPGIIVQQGGYALAFTLLAGPAVPWPLLSLPLTIALLAIWWDGSLAREAGRRPAWVQRASGWANGAMDRLRSAVAAFLPDGKRSKAGRVVRQGAAAPPILALLAAIGMPLTVGAQVRWPVYAYLLHGGSAPRLFLILAADTLLVAGLPLAIIPLWKGRFRPGGASLLALLALALLVVLLGVAPGAVGYLLDLPPVALPAVSAWGLGLVVILPWLVGAWLTRYGDQVGGVLAALRLVVNLDWFYRAASWLGQRLMGLPYWLGLVGEGDGWWGWALAILALGVAFLAVR